MTDPYVEEAGRLDAADSLAAFRDRFVIADPAIVYLDGNSLGRLPRATRDRLRAVADEWGEELIDGWRRWLPVGREAGDLVARIVGAEPGEVVLSDSTGVNLYKLAVAALDARPGRDVIVTDDDNFPTDRYILDGVAAARGLKVRRISPGLDDGVRPEDVEAALDARVALVCLSHVAYRSGAVADLAAVTAAAHRHGALVLWDLCHSAGAVPVGLSAAGADLAVGCTYKYLNGGPGSPAFLYVRRDLQPRLEQPIWGWFGQSDQFAMGPDYRPVPAIERFLVGTPPVLTGYAALEGARLTAEAGIEAVAAKARSLTGYALRLADAWLAPLGFRAASPRDGRRRGAHLTLRHPSAWPVCQAAKAAGVVPDYRAPERLRLGFPPLYTRHIDVHEGLSRLREVAASGRYRDFPDDPKGLT
ncbi:kynureninase [Actinomadura sp. NEAU-AAG7]|uniref:kynureninase n=1 Tax=Actinomadura sp. NEAU-AAG7 TaxID=2839640 RepID=UPI001BE3E1C2|nr:kynureninase [Actinomadura sp. NEAU-AAG7]MBT2211270.1 kynureninase [Actinomadura sp. NEAU-AAG7]